MAESYEDLFARLLDNPALLQEMMTEDVRIRHALVTTEMARQSSSYLKWAVLAAVAAKHYKRQNRLIEEQVWPNCRKKARQMLERMGERISNDRITEEAVQDEFYIQAADIRSKYLEILDIMNEMKEAMRQRKDMLSSFNGDQKKELTDAIDDNPQDIRYNEEDEEQTKPSTNSKRRSSSEFQDFKAKVANFYGEQE